MNKLSEKKALSYSSHSAFFKFLCEFICKFFHILLDIFIVVSSKLLLAMDAAPEISQHIDIRLYAAKYERRLLQLRCAGIHMIHNISAQIHVVCCSHI